MIVHVDLFKKKKYDCSCGIAVAKWLLESLPAEHLVLCLRDFIIKIYLFS